MGRIFKKRTLRELPPQAETFTKNGETFARYRIRKNKLKTVPVTLDNEGNSKAVEVSRTWFARYRNHEGRVVEKTTGCKDEQAAKQVLARWEREAEQIRAGTLNAADLDTAKKAKGTLEEHLTAYESSLVAAGTTANYRATSLAYLRRLAKECGFRCLTDLKCEPIEQFLAKLITLKDSARTNHKKPNEQTAKNLGASARTRNAYRAAALSFAKWCQASGRLRQHDLDRLPRANARTDPRRQRRALTEAEIAKLLAVAAVRPVQEAATIRRGEKKGEQSAELRPETKARLELLGRERVLLYRTLLLTGLRVDELRTLTVGQLDFASGQERLQLNAADEKNREGNCLPLRSDLAADLRAWIESQGLKNADRLFTVPAGLLRILNRDMEAAGIPKRDDRGRTVDVHAMRTTFGTMLSKSGVAPRTAQAALRHSDIKLTMGIYTDPRQLDIRGAVEALPSLEVVVPVPLPVPPAGVRNGHFESISDNVENLAQILPSEKSIDVSAYSVETLQRETTTDNEEREIGLTGFEPATSWSRTKESNEITPTKQGISDDSLSHSPSRSPSVSELPPSLSLIPMLDPELLAIAQAWDKMPENMKAVIRSMAALTNATTPKAEAKCGDGDKLPWEGKSG